MKDGQPKLGDFGLATDLNILFNNKTKSDKKISSYSVNTDVSEVGDASRNLTNNVGTVMYASPEQLNEKNYDSSSDTYSLGLVLFELIYANRTAMEKLENFKIIKAGRFTNQMEESQNNENAFFLKTLNNLITQMLKVKAVDRISLKEVSSTIYSLLKNNNYNIVDHSKTTSITHEEEFINNYFLNLTTNNNANETKKEKKLFLAFKRDRSKSFKEIELINQNNNNYYEIHIKNNDKIKHNSNNKSNHCLKYFAKILNEKLLIYRSVSDLKAKIVYDLNECEIKICSKEDNIYEISVNHPYLERIEFSLNSLNSKELLISIQQIL